MKNLFFTLLVAAFFVPSLNAQCVDCPECGSKVAVGLYKKTSKKVTVYEVTEKEIAVPNICLPKPLFNLKAQFQKLCGKKCVPGEPCGGCTIEECPKHVRNGQIRTIKVMKKSSVKCDACAHEWSIADIEDVNNYLYPPVEPEKEDSGKASGKPPEAPTVAPTVNATETLIEAPPILEAPVAPAGGDMVPAPVEQPSISIEPPTLENAFLIRHPSDPLFRSSSRR